MKRMMIAVVMILAAGVAHAEEASCKARAADQKLAGAALSSFLRKCYGDAAAKCDAMAAEKKLFGAAKTSFVKKCYTTAAGA